MLVFQTNKVLVQACAFAFCTKQKFPMSIPPTIRPYNQSVEKQQRHYNILMIEFDDSKPINQIIVL